MTVTVFPEHDPNQHLLAEQLIATPYTPAWWVSQVITDIPADAVGWLVAQGWQITGITYDETTTPHTPYYAMARQSLQNWMILQSLLEAYVTAHNTAVTQTKIRYNDVVQSWDGMLDNTHDYFVTQGAQQDAQVLLFLGNLDSYMAEVDTLIDENQNDLDALETEYLLHSGTAQDYLTGLGATELARINELFAASLSTQLQQLVDRGLYSSAIAADITARNTRDRDEQIQKLNDGLNREKLDNTHKLYEQQRAMRTTRAEHKHRAIAEKMSEAAARLSGLQSQQTENMQLMKYFLDERNKLLIGLVGFVERREDTYPSFENLVQLATGLGDAGGGWLTP